nr:hypothetical protein Iba_chr04fCG4820 [Ipomoea batatas]
MLAPMCFRNLTGENSDDDDSCETLFVLLRRLRAAWLRAAACELEGRGGESGLAWKRRQQLRQPGRRGGDSGNSGNLGGVEATAATPASLVGDLNSVGRQSADYCGCFKPSTLFSLVLYCFSFRN